MEHILSEFGIQNVLRIYCTVHVHILILGDNPWLMVLLD